MVRIRDALTALPPEGRALLELSLRRGVSDVDIAKLLNVELGDVDRRREEVLDDLSSQLGLQERSQTDELRATLPDMPDELWAPAPTNGTPPPVLTAKPEPKPDEDADRQRRVVEAIEAAGAEEQKGTRGATWALLGVLAIVAVGAVVALTSGDDSGSGGSSSTATAKPAPAPPPTRAATFKAVPGEKGSGRATVRGGVLHLSLSGLPAPGAARYQAWLYDNIVQARSLGVVRAGALTAKLPAGAAKYRYVDISREPTDGNPNHSGASVVRVPLRTLLATGR